MCCNRSLNCKINLFHERFFQLIYTDERLIFDELLALDGTVSIYYQNIQRQGIKMFKTINGEIPEIMNIFFVPEISVLNK